MTPEHEPIPGKPYSFACTCGAEGNGTIDNPEPYHDHYAPLVPVIDEAA